MPVDQAALVGHYVGKVFAHHHPPQVCEDFQIRAMTRLANGEPVSAERAKYFANPIEEVANDVLNEQKAERRLLDCERIWKEPYWSIWTVLSWIAFRDTARLCEITDEDSLRRARWYGEKNYGPALKEAAPESLLLAALKNDELKANSGMPVMAWLHQRTVWQLCRLRMIVWALDAVSADAGHRCPALLPTRVIAGQGIRASFATERAPRIRVRRLRAANLCFAQQRSGNDKRCDDRHPHHGSLPVVVLACPHFISFAEAAERRALSRTSIDGQLSQVKRPPTTGRAIISRRRAMEASCRTRRR